MLLPCREGDEVYTAYLTFIISTFGFLVPPIAFVPQNIPGLMSISDGKRKLS